MDTPNEPDNTIPEIFHSYGSKLMFDRCIDCDRFLLDGSTQYFIEKAIKNYQGYDVTDVIFEYAICIGCAMRFHEQMSQESRQNLTEFMMDHMKDRKRATAGSPPSIEESIDVCLISGKSRDNAGEYQLFAHCIGDQIITASMPYMICGDALDRLSDLLSDKTLDEMDDFMGKHFGPPEFEVGKRRKVVLI